MRSEAFHCPRCLGAGVAEAGAALVTFTLYLLLLLLISHHSVLLLNYVCDWFVVNVTLGLSSMHWSLMGIMASMLLLIHILVRGVFFQETTISDANIAIVSKLNFVTAVWEYLNDSTNAVPSLCCWWLNADSLVYWERFKNACPSVIFCSKFCMMLGSGCYVFVDLTLPVWMKLVCLWVRR